MDERRMFLLSRIEGTKTMFSGLKQQQAFLVTWGAKTIFFSPPSWS